MAGPDTSVGRIFRAFGYSVDGLAGAWRTQGAFRQEVMGAAVLIPIACLLPVSLLERVLLISSVLLVIAVELLNSAIEVVVDRISIERHELSKLAKDMGSAAVLFAIAITVMVWVAVLAPLF
jgi:diacylglycerol kinase (ATP)